MASFRDTFQRKSEACADAPGRVNLLGEHTDYNEGYVLPTTVPQRTRVEIACSHDEHYRFFSADLVEFVEFGHSEPAPAGFARYLWGCIAALERTGVKLPPILAHVSSEIPIGAGLSSSAALEVALLRALRQRFALPHDDLELARLGQQAEVEYVGVRCGILDQMASSLGDSAHMLFLDTRTLEHRRLPLPAADLVVLDSGIARTLATTGYNERRGECEAAARSLGVRALRDVTDPLTIRGLPERLARRVRHVVTENERVLEAVSQVSVARFGELMNESHTSLRDDYQVSVPALDALVQRLQQHECVYGARLTGAGFGGACVALARPGQAAAVKEDVLRWYSALGHHGRALV